MTQNNLANSYNDRIRGDRADNIEQAIEHYEQSLKVYTPEGISTPLPENGLQAGQSLPGRPALL